MKKLFFSIALLIFFNIISVAQTAEPADKILKEGYQQAKKENKNVFIIFHASWCVWCHRMDSSMNDPSCKKYFDDNYVIRHLVVNESKGKKSLENPGANELRSKYYGADVGIPFWLVFDNEGKLLADSKMRAVGEAPEKGENTGCPASEKEVAFFIEILKKTSKLNDGQLEIIRKRFRKNEL